MNDLKDFFEKERQRVFEPDAYFTQRVTARMDELLYSKNAKTYAFWEVVPGSSRPVLVLALMLILCFVAVEMLVPRVPERGMVESFLAPEQSATESFLYNDADVPSRQDVLQQLMALEDQQ